METIPFITKGTTAIIKCKVLPRVGDEFYLCNDYDAVKQAIAEGRPFEAHKVLGMEPVPVTINPAHIITVTATKEDK